ncbi:MAG: tRNA 2-selenouridine(34) synthase MnmH [Thermoleophilia bacterium]
MSKVSVQVPTISVEEAVDGDYVVVDVRSPKEFAESHAVGAVNLPLLGDRERETVGKAYATQGAGAARMVALDAVSADLPSYIRALKTVATRGTRLAVMCWRGGERSRNVVMLLSLVGVHAVQIVGGYKAYRRWVLDGLDAWSPDRPTVTLFGYTGAGKTALLRELRTIVAGSDPVPYVIDLEGLALHRGSLLGGLHQPGKRTQKQFDALVWDALRRVQGDYLIVEGEGGRIGKVFLPQAVAGLVREGIPVLVTASVEERAARIMREYRPESWGPADVERFRGALRLIGERLPPEETAALSRAFDDGRFYDVVRGLLAAYYDPLYQRSSVEGRDFALVFETGQDAAEDAARLATLVAPLVDRRTIR